MLASAKLIDDQNFIAASAKLSEFPYRYNTASFGAAAAPQLGGKEFSSCSWWAGGCRQSNVGSGTVSEYNDQIAQETRPGLRPQTQLFGTAPLRATGDGVLYHTDASNELMLGGYDPHCGKTLMETNYDRFDCVSFPLAAESWHRGGVSTRVGPVYTQVTSGGCYS